MPRITVPVLKDIIQQGQVLQPLWSIFNSALAVEPFYRKSVVRPRKDAAYPQDVSVNPLNFFFDWPNVSEDAAAFSAIKGTSANIAQALINNGQDLTGTVPYPNYALGDATIESLYGASVPALKALRSKYDSKGAFLRTGGCKFI